MGGVPRQGINRGNALEVTVASVGRRNREQPPHHALNSRTVEPVSGIASRRRRARDATDRRWHRRHGEVALLRA